MLTLERIKAGGVEYYLDTTAAGRDHGGGLVDAPGRYMGRAATRLGLSGEAEPSAVRLLMLGVDRATERVLLDASQRHIAAIDMVFSVPKSVSILQALCPDENVRAEAMLGFLASVAAVFHRLEGGAGTYELPGGGRELREDGDVAAVGFVHRLSRAADPHLHEHVVLANMALDPDGEGHCLHRAALYREVKVARELFECHLRYEMTARLGVAWEPLDGRISSDLIGVYPEAIEALSQRTQQIVAVAEAEEALGRAALRAIADGTRLAKDHTLSIEDAFDRAAERLEEAGMPVARLVEVVDRRLPPPGRWEEDALARLAAKSRDGRFSFDEAVAARCRTAPDGRSVDAVLSDVAELLSDRSRVVSTGSRAVWLGGGGPRRTFAGNEATFTVPAVASLQSEVVRLARQMCERDPGALTVVSYPAGGRFEALRSLSSACGAWADEGRTVVAVAPSRFASSGLESVTGIAGRLVGGRHHDDGGIDLRASVASASVVVLGFAEGCKPGELNRVLEAADVAGASVVVLTPERQRAEGWLLGDLASVATGRLPEGPAREQALGSLDETARWRFGGVEVGVTPGLEAAVREIASQYLAAKIQYEAAGGRRPIILAADHAVVLRLRTEPGVQAADVVHPLNLRKELMATGAAGSLPPQLLVLGPASVLRWGSTATGSQSRSHVLVAPGVEPSSEKALGLAAEAGRPGYLVKALGMPLEDLGGRAAWRSCATGIEQYRRRWEIADTSQAFGKLASGECLGRVAEHEQLQRQATLVKALGRGREVAAERGMGGPGLLDGAPGVGGRQAGLGR